MGAEPTDGIKVNDQSDQAAEDRAPGAAVSDDGSGDLVEREEEDDVGGEAGGEQGVVDGVGGEGKKGAEGCGGREHGEAEADVGEEEGAEPSAGESSEDAGGRAGEGFKEGGLLNEESGHGDPVSGLDAEAVVEL